MNKACKRFNQAIKNEESKTNIEKLKTDFLVNRKNYNKIRTSKERKFWKRKKDELTELNTNDPKKFWEKLNFKKRKPPANFAKHILFSYFRNLAGNTDDKIDQSEHTNNNDIATHEIADYLEILDSEISLEEVKKSIDNLENGKAAGIDSIIPELIKSLQNEGLRTLTTLINFILTRGGGFPREWATGIIVPIFKKGDTGDLSNYRGITLLSIVGKIFTGILNSRLKSVIETFSLLNENQAGFRSGYRTTDHIFTLHSLIDNYVYKNKKKLYVCFIDFRKAFDKVNLRHLWKKMIDLGLTGKFLRIIRSMYDTVSSCVIATDGLTDMFKLDKGVRQGAY